MRFLLQIFLLGAVAASHAVFIDLEPNNSIPAAQAIDRPLGAFADVGIMSLTEGDVDVLQISLWAGEVLTAITTPMENAVFTSSDTRMTLFDSLGTPLQTNDDSGPGLGSAIQYSAFLSGTYYLAIAGFDDPFYQGHSTQQGSYTVTLSVVPEPASMFGLTLGLLAIGRRLRRSS